MDQGFAGLGGEGRAQSGVGDGPLVVDVGGEQAVVVLGEEFEETGWKGA